MSFVIARLGPGEITISSKPPGALHGAAPLKMRVSAFSMLLYFLRSGRVWCPPQLSFSSFQTFYSWRAAAVSLPLAAPWIVRSPALASAAPCLPRRTCSISSRTNSPACVDGAFPSRLALRALLMVCFSGIVHLPNRRYRASINFIFRRCVACGSDPKR
jgi:hypothetical protein